ncbi:MAG: histidine kinase [Dysgonomonas sp.]|nr:histidine kinase [Dysgonomonas sp.]
MQDTNNLIIQILIGKRFGILRHLILSILIFFVAFGFIWFMLEDGKTMTPLQQYGGFALFYALFMGSCYLNIYILIPRLLLKNKWLIYFCSLLGTVVIVIITIILFQSTVTNLKGYLENSEYLSGIVNLMSSTLSIFLLFAGTTAFTLFKYWILDMQQAEELESATIQLELKLLENQINPHFLFNMLNNANIMIKKDPDIATHIIAKLEDMLRYQMNGSSQDKVYLKKEILFLDDYLELEKTRRDYFSYTINEDNISENIQVPPLLFITFVENAIKHNLDSRAPSYVHIWFKIEEKTLVFICENSVPQKAIAKQTGGIGLANVKRRLDLLYDGNYSLYHDKTDVKYTVKLELKL